MTFFSPIVSQDCVTGLSLCRKVVHDLFKMTKYEIMQRLRAVGSVLTVGFS